MQDERGKTGELIPVTLLTGFLGSGKTTLLGRLLQKPGMASTAVIINELGEVGLDHLLVAKGEENMVLLEFGLPLLHDQQLAQRDARRPLLPPGARRDPRFKRAVIETTGLADPAPILHMLMTDYFVSAHYALDGIVATVDGVHGESQLDEHPEAIKQAALADRIILTKGDLAGAGALAALRGRLKALNPTAPILEAAHGELDPALILEAGLFDPARKSLDVRRWLREEALAAQGEDRDHAAHDHAAHEHAAHRHDDRIRSFCVYLEGPASWPGYAAWLKALRALSGPDLLRVKGLIEIEGSGRPYVVQGVQHVFSPPLRLEAWPSDDHRSRLVFITRGLERETIEETLRLLRDPSPVTPTLSP